MKMLNLAAALTLIASLGSVQAQTSSYSDIVGYETKALPANTYTSIGINLMNPDLLVSPITSATSTAVAVSGSSNVGALLTSTEPYYVEIKSGSAEGARLDVDVAATIAAANGTIVINVASANNTDPLSSISGSLAGASVADGVTGAAEAVAEDGAAFASFSPSSSSSPAPCAAAAGGRAPCTSST